MNSTFSEDVQNDLSLAVCKAAGSVNGFNQAISQIVSLMQEKELLAEELDKARSENAENRDELTKIRSITLTQAEKLKELNSEL